MFYTNGRGKPFRCRRGTMVEVRSHSEILATLDREGKLEGLPFMPEMVKYCGQRFRVYRRVARVFLDHFYYVARLKGTVLLEDVRCDGASHAGCQMGCHMLWKEAWLKPVDSAAESDPPDHEDADRRHADTTGSGEGGPPTANNGRYCCQATELVKATDRLPWWDVSQYWRDVVCGKMTLGRTVHMLALHAYNKVRRRLGRNPHGFVSGHCKKTPAYHLDLQPGEVVEVKSRAEIEATLDPEGKTRGMGLAPEMIECCGKQYRVAGRADKIILEWSGEMCRLRGTVILEEVTCQGFAMRGCPRNCYHLWKEAWLKRVP